MATLPLAYAITCIFLAAIVRGFSGFGFSLLAISALSLVYAPAEIVPSIFMLELAASLNLLPSIWKDVHWRSLLPLDGRSVYPLQIGGTPLVAPGRLRDELGVPGLYLKDETRTPTGSNKDRATALCLVDAARQGATSIACASSGNVACSLAAGAAAMGLTAYIFVSARTVSPSKVAFMRSFGATVFLVDGPYEQAYRLCDDACARFGWYNRNTASNPLALQAKKTVAFTPCRSQQSNRDSSPTCEPGTQSQSIVK